MKNTKIGKYFKKASKTGVAKKVVPFVGNKDKDIFSEAIYAGVKTGSTGLVPKKKKC
jgi:hypothetical protein